MPIASMIETVTFRLTVGLLTYTASCVIKVAILVRSVSLLMFDTISAPDISWATTETAAVSTAKVMDLNNMLSVRGVMRWKAT